MERKLDPTILVIFGITGDLSREKLLPALFDLHKAKLLPQKFSIVGFARSEFTDESFRSHIKPKNAKKSWDEFSRQIHYHRGDITDPKTFESLATYLKGLESRGHSCANRLFYFATLPTHYNTISKELHDSGLLVGCTLHKRQTRVVVEKPFGRDLKTAKKLDQTLAKYFKEEQIYRIDHYLGKETVQNLLTIRFANSIFEPIWNKDYIDHVQISALEDHGIGNRGAFYEQTGVIRDFVQNHLIQILSLIAMEPPADLATNSIRDERAKVISSIMPPSSQEIGKNLVTGQYEEYRDEKNVSPKSRTETFAAIKLFLASRRWEGVPFYLRTGKKLAKKITQISIHFKTPSTLFKNEPITPNVLIFEIQPNEGIFLVLTSKFPGFGIRLHPVTMELGYHSAFKGEFPEAYERLLLDFIEGDQRLFARSDEIEQSWKYIDQLEKYLSKSRKKPEIYKAGTWGPETADKLIAKDNRQWHIQ